VYVCFRLESAASNLSHENGFVCVCMCACIYVFMSVYVLSIGIGGLESVT